MSDEIDRLEQAAAAPKRAKTAAGEVESHSLSDQIAVDRYLAAKRTAGNPFGALRMGSFVPPSALGEHDRGASKFPPLPSIGR